MKTLLLILFPILSYSQSFMMKMEVREIYKDISIINDTIKVIWIVEQNRSIGFLWNGKVLYFTKKKDNPSFKERRAIKEISREYNLYTNKDVKDRYFKIRSLYMDHNGELYHITIYMNNGVLIWISRIKDRLPCYFFRMV